MECDMEQPAFVSILQAGEYLGIKRSSVYRLLNEGKLASTRLGNRRLVPVKSLEELAAKLMESE
jgi:excisionase family DNA binding protein